MERRSTCCFPNGIVPKNIEIYNFLVFILKIYPPLFFGDHLSGIVCLKESPCEPSIAMDTGAVGSSESTSESTSGLEDSASK